MADTDTTVPGKKAYISLEEAEAAMTALRQEDIEAFGMVIPECFPSASAIEALNKIPAADVVEVVRCSVCKKVVLEDRGNGKSAYWCPVNRNYRCWDEFCNRGERRADNG